MDSSPGVFTKEEGLRLLKAGQLNDAIKVLEKVREKVDDASVCSYLGAAYDQKGDRVNAIHAFEESLRLSETPKAYYNLAVVYESVGRIDEAVREYRMAVELDPNYKPAADAIERLHNKFAADHPEQEAAVAAQPTQSMPAGPGAPSQTQSFAGPPPQGPTVGQAPAQALADPFARSAGPPPTQADLLARQMAKEQAIADQHHALMKAGIIYGAICGAVVIVGLYFAMQMVLLGGMPKFAYTGMGLIVFTGIVALVGAAYGCLIGLWVGYTCGGEGAGMQAGAAMGAVLGLVLGLLLTGSPGGTILTIVMFGVPGGCTGLLIGRLVDISITD